MEKRYNIAELRLRICSEQEIENRGWSELFEVCEEEGQSEFQIDICVAELPEYSYESKLYELYAGGKRRTLRKDKNLISYYREPNRNWQFCYEESDKYGKLTVTPEYAHYASDIRNIWNKIDLSRILLRRGGLILHAAYIIWNGQGILFTAPSGTGKSTQADLWKRYRQAEIVNGDRAVIREKNGVVWSYSLPFAGSSGICINKSCPLKAIVILGQAAENSVRTIGRTGAIKYLYAQSALNRWNREEVEAVMEILGRFVYKVEVLKLDCLPNQGAVEILADYLEKAEERGN